MMESHIEKINEYIKTEKYCIKRGMKNFIIEK